MLQLQTLRKSIDADVLAAHIDIPECRMLRAAHTLTQKAFLQFGGVHMREARGAAVRAIDGERCVKLTKADDNFKIKQD